MSTRGPVDNVVAFLREGQRAARARQAVPSPATQEVALELLALSLSEARALAGAYRTEWELAETAADHWRDRALAAEGALRQRSEGELRVLP